MKKEEKEEKEKLAFNYGVALMKFISTQSLLREAVSGGYPMYLFLLEEFAEVYDATIHMNRVHRLVRRRYCKESQKVYEKFIGQILSDLRRGLRTYSPKIVLARLQKLKHIYFAPAKNALGWGGSFEGSWLTLDR